MQIDRIIQVKAFLIDARLAQPQDATNFELEKKINKPATTLKYTLQLPEDSPFKKFPNLYKEQITWQWQQATTTRTDTLVTFLYKPKRGNP